jgi:hypothetical protein
MENEIYGLRKRIANYEKDLELLEENNDGSLEWVDNVRDIADRIFVLELKLCGMEVENCEG